MHSPEWGKRTAVQIVFGTLSTCYFISQMENNNTGSGVGTTTPPKNERGLAQLVATEFAPFFLICKVIFVRAFDRWNSVDWQTHMMINDKVQGWQSTRYWGKSYRISVLIQKKKIFRKRLNVPIQQTGQGFFINRPASAPGPPKLNECVRSWMIYTFGLI